ncbi:MAG TPA: class I SAM-dependent methyltransferase [Candidatus Nanoarchaeia archaeon]|nr:class I SAM-dependent methyltransferase [Candidatus Nanoarchaeia archaeon]
MYYDFIAAGYDKLYEEEQIAKLKNITKYYTCKGLILDVGAGSGVSSRFFASQARVIALDTSEELLSLYEGEKVVARAESLPFRDHIFDAVVSVTALHHADFKQALREIKRVVKPNGQIVLSLLKLGKNTPVRLKGFQKLDNGKDWLFIRKIFL